MGNGLSSVSPPEEGDLSSSSASTSTKKSTSSSSSKKSKTKKEDVTPLCLDNSELKQKISAAGASSVKPADVKFLSNAGLMYEKYFQYLLPEFSKGAIPVAWLQDIYKSKGAEGMEFHEFCEAFFEYKKEIGNRLVVKLFLTTLGGEGGVGAIGTKLGSWFSEFGAVHAGVQVGPFLIDWTTAEVVVPRPFKSRNCIMLLDLTPEKHSKLRMSKKNLMKICNVMVKWNCLYSYKQMKMPNDDCCGNCHNFTKDILAALNLKPWWEKGGPVHSLIKYIRNNANTTKFKAYQGIRFSDSEELKKFIAEKFPEKDKSIYFGDEVFEICRAFNAAFLINGKFVENGLNGSNKIANQFRTVDDYE